MKKEISKEDYFKNTDKVYMERWPETCVTTNKMLLYRRGNLKKNYFNWLKKNNP